MRKGPTGVCFKVLSFAGGWDVGCERESLTHRSLARATGDIWLRLLSRGSVGEGSLKALWEIFLCFVSFSSFLPSLHWEIFLLVLDSAFQNAPIVCTCAGMGLEYGYVAIYNVTELPKFRRSKQR